MAEYKCWCYTSVVSDIPHPHNTETGCPVLLVPGPAQAARTVPGAAAEAIENLVAWWEKLASSDARTTVPKAVEYGSADLIEIGRAMARATGRPGLSDTEAAELGIYFYVVGKLGRWTAAVEENRPVSDDTLFDISVYITMVRRIRATGGWPYATQETPEKPQQVPCGNPNSDCGALGGTARCGSCKE